MMKIKKMSQRLFIAIILNLALGAFSFAGSIQNYANPLDVKVADVFILKHNTMYYLYGTASNGYEGDIDGIPVWSSENMINWIYQGHVIQTGPGVWGQKWFWGPHVVEKNGTFYLYYNAYNDDVYQKGRICVATAASPIGPFTEVAAPMFTPPPIDAMDPAVFVDDDGEAYLYYVNVVNDGGDHEHHIYGARLNPDMISLATSPVKYIEPSQAWESWVNEAPYVAKHDGVYYLMYSGSSYTDSYSIGYATSTSPTGPWTKYMGNPFMTGSGDAYSPGSHCFVDSLDGTETFIAYHKLIHPDNQARELAIDRVTFEPNGSDPDTIVVAGPTTSPQPYPSGVPFTKTAVSDEFDGSQLNLDTWNTVWGQSTTNFALSGGWLQLPLSTGDVWQQVADTENIFLQLAPEGNWTIMTRVNYNTVQNFEQAFITVWQDSNNYLMLKKAYIDGQRFTASLEVDGVYQDINTQINPYGETVYIGIQKTGNTTYRCYYSNDGVTWTNIGGTITANFDEIKVGFGATLHFSSRTDVTAQFDLFRIERENSSADINMDGFVDLQDFGQFSGDYGEADSIIRLTGDINENGVCDLEDFLILAEDWLGS